MNSVNVYLLYSAFLQGISIKFSTSTEFYRRKDSWIAEVNIYGVIRSSSENSQTKNDRKIIDLFIDKFFKETTAPRTRAPSNKFKSDILSTDSVPFFYLLSKEADLEKALKFVNRYINYETLNDIAQKLDSVNKKKWDELYEKIQEKGKLVDKDQLELLVNLFITVKSRVTGKKVLYQTEITNYFETYIYDINDEYDVEINQEFHEALYLNKYKYPAYAF